MRLLRAICLVSIVLLLVLAVPAVAFGFSRDDALPGVPIGLGATAGVVDMADVMDVYAVQLYEGQNVSIGFSSPTDIWRQYWLTLYSPATSEIDDRENPNAGVIVEHDLIDNNSGTMAYTASQSGVYYIRVRDAYNSNSYTLSISGSASRPSTASKAALSAAPGSTTRPVLGAPTTLRGEVTPEFCSIGLPNVSLIFEQSYDGVAWSAVSTQIAPSGVAYVTVTATRSTQYRARFAGDGVYAAGTSQILAVRPLAVVSVQGTDRVSTAIAASKKAFTSSTYVVVSTAFNWPDALGGSALAGALNAPILLTSPASLSGGVAEEIARLGATKVVVLGGVGAVSASVAGSLDALSGVSIERIAGAGRYETANKVAARTIAAMGSAYDGTAFVATGANFPDALGASPLAAAKVWPIYLANPSAGSNSALASAMKAEGVTKAVILGGTGAVTPSVETGLRTSLGSATRIAGSNRYDTAVKVATYGTANAGLGWDKLAVATGAGFPDALAGGVLQGRSNAVMLLTPTDVLDPSVQAILAAKKASIGEVRFLGGTGAVSTAVRTAVRNALM